MRFNNWYAFGLLLLCFSTVRAQEFEGPIYDIEKLVLKWNKAIDGHDIGDLKGLYLDEVEVYGQSMTRGECLDGKIAWLKKHAGYRQEVEGVDELLTEEDHYRAIFEKSMTENGKTTKVKAFLDFVETESGAWKIKRESD
ncbi:MAG: hypothetical protein AAF570_02160, partial [Bacteroidota bacterium]